MKDQILVVEDDRDIARLLQMHLQELSLESHHVGSAELALQQLEKHT